jgi:TRAP-type mannitol/chloroaromatic compound transport system permease small subunit
MVHGWLEVGVKRNTHILCSCTFCSEGKAWLVVDDFLYFALFLLTRSLSLSKSDHLMVNLCRIRILL